MDLLSLVLVLMGVGAGGTVVVTKDCDHGTLNVTANKCICDDDWDFAGISDVINYAKGKCMQFRCQSDDHCRSATGIEADCPWHSWNCYCGWQFIMEGYFTGHDVKDGRCMGVMYTFIFWLTGIMETILMWLWAPFLPLIVLGLLVGRKRFVCSHSAETVWNYLRQRSGCFERRCDGSCISPERYDLDCFYDDIAWAIYFFSVMVWSYAFFVALYLVLCAFWFTTIWSTLAIVCIVSLVCSCCMLMASSGACNGSADCNFSCDCRLDGCGCCGENHNHSASADNNISNNLYGSGPLVPEASGAAAHGLRDGPYPSDPLFGTGGYGYIDLSGTHSNDAECCGCCRACFRFFCFPVTLVLNAFPIMPENMWGGIVGRLMGTHVFTPEESRYRGPNCFVDFMRMGWRRRADLHTNVQWREEVSSLLARDRNARYPSSSIRGVQILTHRDEFTREQCFSQSSYDDYRSNKCWICMEEPGSNSKWDIWMSCGHLFCARCSSEMLTRRMACPLCRMWSTSVLRGPASTLRGRHGGLE
mmetsp:Transcript_115300/g.333079  ORF Transcript_115300/g.333079 Transcript_115300/m.333079 type:complete len:531 (-) Transcript_115300:101-1693(-)